MIVCIEKYNLRLLCFFNMFLLFYILIFFSEEFCNWDQKKLKIHKTDHFQGKNVWVLCVFYVLFPQQSILFQVRYVLFVLGPLTEENFFEWEALIS